MLAETCSFYHLIINNNEIYIVALLTVIALPINYMRRNFRLAIISFKRRRKNLESQEPTDDIEVHTVAT